MRFHILACALVLSSLTFAGVVRADSPGAAHDICVADGLGCTTCSDDPLGSGGADSSGYATCAADATSKGLVDACQDFEAGQTNHYFCPQGVTVPTKTVGGGCSIGAVPAGGITGGVLVGLGLAALLRRRSRR